MPATDFSALVASQIAALSRRQVHEHGDFAVLGDAGVGVQQSQLSALNTTQIQGLREDQVALLTTDQVGGFTAAQLCVPRQSVEAMSPAQLAPPSRA